MKPAEQSGSSRGPVSFGDMAGLGTSGAAGYGLYRVGRKLDNFHRDLSRRLADVGVSRSSRFNPELLSRLDALAASANLNNVAENAFLYPDLMHYAALQPVIEGESSLTSVAGLKRMHEVGGAVTDSFLEHIGRPGDKLVRALKRLRAIPKSVSSSAVSDAISLALGNVARTAGDAGLAGGREHLRHFRAFGDGPVSGYLKLLDETGLHASKHNMTPDKFYDLLDESRNFAGKGFKSQEEYFRSLLYRDFPDALKGDKARGMRKTFEKFVFGKSTPSAPVFSDAVDAFNALRASASTSGVAPGALREYILERGLGVNGADDRAKSVFELFSRRLRESPDVAEQLARSSPGGITTIRSNRSLLGHLVNPIVGAKGKTNALAYAGTGKLMRAVNIIRDRRFGRVAKGLKHSGYALPVLAAFGLAYKAAKNSGRQRK